MILDIHADIFTDIFNKGIRGESDIIKRYHLSKFNKGGINGGIFVFWLDPKYNDYENLKTMMDYADREIEIAKDFLCVAKNYNEYYDALKSGKITVMINLEGAKSIEDDINRVDEIYEYGIRFLSLTWNEENKLATGVKSLSDSGLKERGKDFLKRIQNRGIVVDVSHASDKTFFDIVKHTKKPIIASHSNCRKLCNEKRNLLDDQIKLIKETGGIIGVNAYRDFIHVDREKQDATHLVNHIDHMVDLIGIDSVCFGLDYCDYIDDQLRSDLDTADVNKNGLYDVSRTQEIVVKLKSRGYSQNDIEKISYKNFLKFIKDNINS